MMDRFETSMILYRPVGLQELALIYDSGMTAFPARLPQQPIFYPVLQLEYARQTASDWNAKNGQFAGYVTQFKVEDEYIDRFEEHTVGGSQYQELWVPAEEMDEFNKHITGHIKVVEAHFGDAFEGFVPETFGLQGKNAVAQFTLLANSYLYKRMEFYLEIKRNHKAIFLNYPFWQTHEFKNPGLKEKVLQAIKEAWLTSFPKIPLPPPPPVPERAPSVNQPAERSLVDPIREDITLVEQADSDSLVDPVDEESTPVEAAELDSLVDAVEEDNTPAKEIDAKADALADFDDEDITPVRNAHLRSFLNPVPKDILPVEPTDSNSMESPVEEDITPAEPPRAHFLANPVHRAPVIPRQTDSPFVQGIKLGLRAAYMEAIAALSKAIEEEPEHVVAHTSLGVAYHRLGEDDRARESYETALRIDPIHAEAHYFRSNILYSQGNAREAVAGYTIAIGLEPELIEAHRKPIPQDRLTDYSPSPAEMYWIAKPAHRILHLNKSIDTNPGQASLFKERAAEYYRLRNYVQAIADYSSSLAIQPDDAGALHLRGVAYEQLGQHERALEDYQQAIAIDPQLANMYINRGVNFGRMGNFQQSLASLTDGIRLAPTNPDAYFNRGTTYFQLGDFERAIEDFSNVIRLSPEDEAAYYWRGISNEEAGRQREAIVDYRQFLMLSRDANANQEVERRLSQWHEGKRDEASSRSGTANDRQKTDPVLPEKPDQKLDLYDLVAALGDRALRSIWFGSGVECYGETAKDLYAFTDQNRPIEGNDFLYLISGIRQTTAGDFYALDPGATSHWIFIRAWDGSGFYMESNDVRSRERLKAHFPSVEEVEGAAAPYVGLFLRL